MTVMATPAKRRRAEMRRKLGPIALVVTVLLTAPIAKADQFDFISDLDRQGVYYGSVSDMIEAGKLACAVLGNGGNSEAVDAIGWYLVNDRKFSPTEAGLIVRSAAQNMCQDTLRILNGYGAAPVR